MRSVLQVCRVRSGQDRSGQVRSDEVGPSQSGSVWSGLGRAGQGGVRDTWDRAGQSAEVRSRHTVRADLLFLVNLVERSERFFGIVTFAYRKVGLLA